MHLTTSCLLLLVSFTSVESAKTYNNRRIGSDSSTSFENRRSSGTTTRQIRSTTPDSIESAENGQMTVARNKRQVYYLCGNFPNQYLSLTQCNNGCSNCNNCQYRCSTNNYCQQIQSNWRCVNGCCRMASFEPTLPPTTAPSNPVCGGRETSGGYCRSGGTCGSGYMCNDNNVCCRCSYGTSIGPCVNQQCPDNTYCSPTNNCCPYLTTG